MAKPFHYDKHKQLCILSVDDDTVNLMVIEQLLMPQGWKIISAQDGMDALSALEENDTWPDLVFLDFYLEVGDSGDEVCRKMRKVFGSTPVPIIMCTAMTAGASALDDCMRAGATDILLKPYERTKMLEKIEQYCGAKAKAPARAPAAPTTPAQPAAPAPAPAAPAQPAEEDLASFFQKLDLEYCGQKLAGAGYTLKDVGAMDDSALRKAGIVVKGQRDKIIAAFAAKN